MTRRLALALVLVAPLVAACKEKAAKQDQRSPGPRPSAATFLPRLPTLVLPDDSRRAQKIALGHTLFFDKRLSANNDRACAACHVDDRGAGERPLARQAPALWNISFSYGALYWDGHAKTLEEAITADWSGAMGVGLANLDAKAADLAASAGYKERFADAFGPTTAIGAGQVASAIVEYLHTLACTDTAYDTFATGDKSALTEQQQRGFDLFVGKAGCATCHSPPHFSTAMGVDGGAYFNVGIGTDGVPDDKVDIGRMKVTNDPRDWASFKPPSLRDVRRNAPYFHDGSRATLDDAVRLMATGGIKNKNLNPVLVDRGLTDAEMADVLAFLGALDCPGTLEAPAPAP